MYVKKCMYKTGRNELKYYINVLNLFKVNKDINPLIPPVHKMIKHTLERLQHLLQDL